MGDHRVIIWSRILWGLCLVVAAFTTKGTDAQYKGMYSSILSEAEITLPKKVTSEGKHLSHDTTHYHDGQPVYYNITLTNKDHFLILHPEENFLAPSIIIERHKRDTYVRTKPQVTSTKCHYRGIVHGQPNSAVALSSCNGLIGMIKLNSEEYWIEPMHHEIKKIGPKYKHLIFRRSATDSKSATRKRKRKKKRHHLNNCGTREPKRYTESELEWQKKMGKIKVQGKRKNRMKNNVNKLKRNHEHKRHARKPRSVSRPRYVETMLVADSSMIEFHEGVDVEAYLLTIMNMVSSLYLDPSIGNLVNVVVVRIMLLEEEREFNTTVNADITLKEFCKWQMSLNPKNDSHPHHHDVAILVTRRDICARKNTPCSTLGVAHVAGMCRPDKSCSVNEDNGITLAHTITHEMGHNFGMYHDNEKTGCHHKEGDTMHVMTPTFEADAIGVSWSRCSRRDITNFFDLGLGKCLDDEPQEVDYSYPELPAGAMYNANHQCRLQFGSEAEVCSPLQEICSRLWCDIDGTCTTLLRPAAPGTHCGKRMWCQNQECVPAVDPPSAIDGGWGDWSPWSECSRSCGAGVSIMQRECDHPKPASGGKFCVGERRRYRICNTQPCPEDKPSFRATQCTYFNNESYNGQMYTWLPYFEQSEPCELYCTDINETVIVPWGEHAADGTPCNVGARDVCISGICRKVGCDWVVDSDAREDACGVCQGDGSSCDIIQDLYVKQSQNSGYKEVTVIPAGSRNIRIEEIDYSENYLSIGSTTSKKFYLNGHRQITLGGEYEVAGTPALYERDNEFEKIRIPGPTKEDILVYVIFRGKVPNPGILYQYTVTKRNLPKEVEYHWSMTDWSPCSATCGGGIQHRRPVCLESSEGIVDTNLCTAEDQPEQRIRACHTEACPSHWWFGPWQSCPVTCHTKGVKPMRRRSVMCVDGREMALPDHFCESATKPQEHEPCHSLSRCPESR